MKKRYVSLGTYQASFRLDEGSILAVHLVVKSASVAEVMPSAISSPKGRRCRSTVDTLATLYWNCIEDKAIRSISHQFYLTIGKTTFIRVHEAGD